MSTSTGNEPLIDVVNLVKKYGDFTALDDLSFSIRRGEIVGFLGPNGAGKTTTMKIITGYIPATRGTVMIDGRSTFLHSLDCRRRIGYLPEDVPLYNDMKVKAYLAYVCRLRDIPSADIPFRLDRIIGACNLEPVRNKLIRQLSKGNRQRVGLAQALVHEPEILVLDEPTIGLDPQQVINIRELITRLRENHTVILSTHILSEVEQMCDRVIIINRGRICLDRRFDELEPQAGRDYAVTVLGDEAGLAACLAGIGTLSAVKVPEAGRIACTVTLAEGVAPERIARAVIGAGLELREVRGLKGDLESVFLEAIAR